ncbi:MAG: response regulator [Gammaproteobacteria bacterium]|nr:response regulator [Gammaproteobacteria bacterium]
MSVENSQILIVDDSRVIRRAAVKILEKEFQVIEAEDGELAWDELKNNPAISVVFSDLGMPNMDGYELLETIRKSDDPAISNLPVIIITGAEESEGAREEVLRMGATDFISKPFDSITLKSRAAAHINYRNEVQSLEKIVAADKLTGLATDLVFKDHVDQALAYALRHHSDLTLVRCDIDHFAEFFVKHGKEVAEQILKKISAIVKEGLRKEDTAGRLGLSQIGLLLPATDAEGATQVMGRICQRVSGLKIKLGGRELKISISTGITTPQDLQGLDVAGLIDQAELALARASKGGGGKMVLFQTAARSQQPEALPQVDVDIEELLDRLSLSQPVSNEQLASAMRLIIPLISEADQKLRLGLAKVVAHLQKRLKL